MDGACRDAIVDQAWLEWGCRNGSPYRHCGWAPTAERSAAVALAKKIAAKKAQAKKAPDKRATRK